MGWRIATVGVLSLALLAGCDQDPKQVYYGMSTAAELGDRKGFLNAFTKESQPLIEAQISLSEAYSLKKSNPITQLVFGSVDSVKINEDKAIVSVSKGKRKKRILMVKTEEDGWRIDTRKLKEFWDSERKKR